MAKFLGTKQGTRWLSVKALLDVRVCNGHMHSSEWEQQKISLKVFRISWLRKA